jgi:hypothetical protein
MSVTLSSVFYQIGFYADRRPYLNAALAAVTIRHWVGLTRLAWARTAGRPCWA